MCVCVCVCASVHVCLDMYVFINMLYCARMHRTDRYTRRARARTHTHTPNTLSGGELQRFAIAVVAVQKADVYMFDEPSSYLDVKQRIHACKAIRSLLKQDNYVIVVEHDLAVCTYTTMYGRK